MIEERIEFLTQINRLRFIELEEGCANKLYFNEDGTINHEVKVTLSYNSTHTPIWHCVIYLPSGRSYLSCDAVLDVAIAKSRRLANQGGYGFLR